MKLYWAGAKPGVGGFYGYSTHSRKLREALIENGVIVTDDPVDCDLAVHICHPHQFQKTPRLRNVLFTTVETRPLPQQDREPIQTADLIVVPSRFCKDVFAEHFPVERIHVCNLGNDPVEYPFYQRHAPADGELFVFLFVGTLDLRKGSEILSRAWLRWHRSGAAPENAYLYLKYTGGKHDGVRGVNPKVIMDGRDLPQPELRKLYESAHAFVLPSIGEGFGLTACEAAASGLPVIFTRWGGMTDFLDAEVGYPLKFSLLPLTDEKGKLQPETQGAKVKESDLIRQLERVYRGYGHALKLGKKASERIHSRFTWARAAEKFIEICRAYV